MFKNFNFNVENCFWALLLLFLTAFGTFLVAFAVSKKHTYQYSLGGYNGDLKITKEIDWCSDDEIQLDRSVTYWDAIRMVDSLNASLKK